MCRKVLSTGVIVLLIMTLTGVVNAAPGTGLVGYFKMNETTGDVAGDSVSGKDGFLDYGVNWSASGKLGGAADFATVDNKYNIIYADDITQQMSKTSGTVAVWMKQTSGATSARRETTRVLFDFNGGSGSRIQLWTADGSASSTRLNLGLGNKFEFKHDCTGNANLTPDTWYHVAVTWNAGAWACYLDGVSKTSGSGASGYTLMTADIAQGAIGNIVASGTDESDQSWIGWIDEVGIWNVALSAADVLSVKTNGIEFYAPTYAKASDPTPGRAAENAAIDAVLGWKAGTGATSHDVYFGTANPPPFIANQTAVTYDPAGYLSLNGTYYWRVNEQPGSVTGDVWSFVADAGRASKPSPAVYDPITDKTLDIGEITAPTLSWTKGRYATSHNVYFGTVNPPPLVSSSQADPNYTVPYLLALNTMYYWRIDENNGSPASGVSIGDVWKFKTDITGSFTIDGAEGTLFWTGALRAIGTVVRNTTPWPIHSGLASVKMTCGNFTSAYNSEMYHNFSPAQDLTYGGITKSLSIWYVSVNPALAQLYARAKDSNNVETTVILASPVLNGNYQEWPIAFSSFTGVDWSKITKLTIGVGNGTQTVNADIYFDDIKVYTPRCLPALLKPAGDLNNDCKVNIADLTTMATDWLVSDSQTIGRDVVLVNFPTDNSQWVTGIVGAKALKFDGVDDWIPLNPYWFPDFHGATIMCWVKNDGVQTSTYRTRIFSTNLSFPQKSDEYPIELAIHVGDYYLRGRLPGEGQLKTDLRTQLPMAVGTWYHVALVLRDSSDGLCTGEVYRNGGQVPTETAGMKHPRHYGSYLPGANIGSALSDDGGKRQDFINATIDDFRIYDYNLPATEIANVNDGLGEPSPGPILRYAFNETSGLIAEDSGVDGANPIYNPNTSVANIVKKSPAGGPYDANNKDIVNGKDYSSMAFTWQDLVLWPAP